MSVRDIDSVYERERGYHKLCPILPISYVGESLRALKDSISGPMIKKFARKREGEFGEGGE